MMDVHVYTEPPNELAALGRRIRNTTNPAALRKRTTAGLKQGTKPALIAVRRSALTLPSKHGHGETRARVAAAAGVYVRLSGRSAGVKVAISRAKMKDKAAFPRQANVGVWRHRVFGRDTWVTQRSRRGWFDNANYSQARAVRSELQKVMRDINKDIANH